MAELRFPDMHEMIERGCGMWPLGHGSVLTTVGVVDGKGVFGMAAVPDEMLAVVKAAPEHRDFQTLLAGDGPLCFVTFDNVKSLDGIIEMLKALKYQMMEMPS